jgi:hypothetical protein
LGSGPPFNIKKRISSDGGRTEVEMATMKNVLRNV